MCIVQGEVYWQELDVSEINQKDRLSVFNIISTYLKVYLQWNEFQSHFNKYNDAISLKTSLLT